MIKSTEKSNFDKLAKECITDEQKVDFFDRYKAAFFSDIADGNLYLNNNLPRDIDDAFHIYANMKRMSEGELDKLFKLPWKSYPTNFKIFLFDFYFLISN